jgi:hypothetical protein
MKFYIDEANDNVFVDNSTYIVAMNCTPKIGNGGEFSVTYERDETNFLSDLSTLLGYRGKDVKFTDDTNTYVYMRGFIQDCINITLTSLTFVGYQAIRLLQDYPASYDPVDLSFNPKSIVSNAINDEWDEPFGATNGLVGKLLTTQDTDKRIWKGHPYSIDTRDWADPLGTADTPNQSVGADKNVHYDNGDYGKTASSINYQIVGNRGGGAAHGDRMWYMLTFRVPKTQGTTFKNAWLTYRCKTTRVHTETTASQRVRDMFVDIWHVETNYTVYNVNKVTTNGLAKDLDKHMSYEADTGIQVAHTDHTGFTDYETLYGELLFTEMLALERQLLDDIDHSSESDFWYNKQTYNDQGIDTFDLTLLVSISGADIVASGDFNAGQALFYAMLEVEFVEDQAIPIGSDVIASNLNDYITFTLGDPYPVNDGWSLEDICYVTPNLSTELAACFTASGADSIFTLTKDTVSGLTDINVQTNTPMLRILQLYGDIAGKTYWEHNLTVKWTSTFASSGITITETDIEMYPANVTYARYGSEGFDKIRVVGHNDQQYELDITEPVTAHSKIKVISNPDVVSSSMAKAASEGLQNYYETDMATVTFLVRLTTGMKQNLLIGTTVAVNLESTSYVNYTGANALLVTQMQYFVKNNSDYAVVTCTNRYLS